MFRSWALLLSMALLTGFPVCARAEELPSGGAAPAPPAPGAAAEAGPVWIVQLHGPIDSWLARYFKRSLAQAQRAGARFIVVEIKTNGGDIDAMNEMIESLLDVREARTVAFVVSKAISAGAGIALACDEIYLGKGVVIGSVLPYAIGIDLETRKPVIMVTDKLINAVREKLSAVAQEKGHSTALAEAMVDPRLEAVEAKVDGERRFMLRKEYETALEKADQPDGPKVEFVDVVCEKDRVLALSKQDAVAYGLAKDVEDRGSLLEKLGAASDATVVEIAPSPWEKVARFLSSPALSGILVVLAVIALMIEIKTPSLGIGGATFLFFIGIFFWSKFMAGQSGPVEIIFFLVGGILVALEIFVIPGFGVPGIAGLACIALSLLLSFVPESAWPPDFAARPWLKDTISQSVSTGIVTIAVAGVAGFAAFLALKRLLPHAPLVSAVFLPADAVGGRAVAPVPTPMLEERAAAAAPVGAVGTAESDLHTSGKALFGDALVDVVTEGDFIARGAKVRVIEVSGNRVVVTQA